MNAGDALRAIGLPGRFPAMSGSVLSHSEDLLAAARAYDRWFDGAWGRYADGIEARAVLHGLGSLGRARVLEAGCGTGRLLERLASAGADLTGVDADAAMLTIARERVDVPLVRGDIRALPHPTETFDAVVAVTVLEFVQDPRGAITELCRVTRPGGRVVVGTLNPRSPWGVAHRRRLREVPWVRARFLRRHDLRRLGSTCGRVRLRGALFAPGHAPRVPWLGRAVEGAGRVLPWIGAFQIMVIERR